MSEEQLIPTPGVFGENGNFLLERELGRGGMGGVYMGRDKMLDRPVAVKVMLPEYGSDEEFVGKFKKEAQAVARLIHPNIAQVYSYGISNGMPYIAMELVAGGSLDGLMKHHGKDIEVPRVMKICEQVAQALRCAADQGLVHGDVKPENILLDANGNAKLVDFGLAAMQKDTEEIWGTPYYIAPEKCRRQPVDYRADMYSLGGTIYHALTGQAPFEGEDANEVVKARFMGPPKKPSELRPGLSPQIDNLVMTMLAVDPKDRYPSFEALLEEFKKVMTTGLSMTSPISPAAAASAGAASGAGTPRKTTIKGGKKVMLKPKKGFKVKTQGLEGDVPPIEGDDALPPVGDDVPSKLDDEDEEGGNLGAKVLGVVGGVILAILLIGGGLWWYVQHAKAVEEEEHAEQARGHLAKAHASLSQARQFALDHAQTYEEKAATALSECEALTAEMRELYKSRYSDNIIAMLKPAEPADLIAARAELEKPLDASAAAAPEPAPAPAAEPAPNADGASNAAPAASGDAAPAAPAPAEESAEPAAAEEKPATLKEVNDLWMVAYGIQTRVYRIRREVNILVSDIDKAMKETDMAKAVSLANSIADRYNELVGNPETEKALKDSGRISGKRSNIVNKERRNKSHAEQLEQKAHKEKSARIAEFTKKLADKQAELAKAEEEIEIVRQCFAASADPSQGDIKYFDWARMKRKLNALQLESPYAENQRKKELRKVEALELSQKVLMDNMKDYTFKRPKRKGDPGIKGGTVASVDAKQIVVSVGGKKKNITWTAFYRDYHTNLDELIGKFIRDGRQNQKKRLTHGQWVNSMIGTAYTLLNLCSDDATVGAFVDGLVKEAVVADIRLHMRNGTDGDEEPEQVGEITDKDEDVKALKQQIAETTAKLDAIDIETRKVPYYRELFPNADYEAFKAAAAED